MNLMSLLNDHKLQEANLKNLYSDTVSQTPKIAQRSEQIASSKLGVRYYGLSEDGTWNFKVRSQSVPGGFYYVYIEAPDMLKFDDIYDRGDSFTVNDLAKLLTMNSFRIHCNDPSFLYYGFQYMATKGNYEIEPETRPADTNNPGEAGGLCKHLAAVIKTIYYDNQTREQLSTDIDNYLRMLVGLDYEDYQQEKHANQIRKQNRAVKWKNNTSDYMNDYFAREAKNHPYLDDHDIKKSLKKEMNKFIKAKPESTVDDFLRTYFGMTQKAFSDKMNLPENDIEDYFNEIGWEKQHEKVQPKEDVAPEIDEELLNDETSTEEPVDNTKSNILTKDSEQLTEDSKEWDQDKENLFNEIKSIAYKMGRTIRKSNYDNLTKGQMYNIKIKYLTMLEKYKKLNESEEKHYYTIKEAHEEYKKYLEGHIKNVQAAMNWIVAHYKDKDPNFIPYHKQALIQCAYDHDKSKYEDEEFFPYLHHFYPTCEEDEMKTEEFEQACKHHIKSNPHHWDFWIDDEGNYVRKIEENDDMYKCHTYERVCDWLAMAAQHDEYKSDWYEINKDSIKMPDWAHELVEDIFKSIPDDFYTFMSFNGTRGEKDK